jgi:hypothetical protein
VGERRARGGKGSRGGRGRASGGRMERRGERKPGTRRKGKGVWWEEGREKGVGGRGEWGGREGLGEGRRKRIIMNM